MRRRKVKGADEKLLSYDKQVIKNPVDFKGKWSQKFNNDNPIYIEVGTGRGKFLTTLAKENPDINFIAMEIKEEVLLKAVQKADEGELNNILFIWGNVNNILEYFEDKEISRLFINFCDPWPKKRWAKRRLTHSNFLDMYNKILTDDGEIHFKTDNEKLFEFSLNQISEYGLKLQNVSLDLANSEFEGNVTTEYEDKFMNLGMKIYRCEGKKR
ncbi:tRNA (guanosine(46)-N7)-methyltransferase TrmB [Tepidibacter hydrothermalis]|uniref:tRNA (guanine-N(7)-)-methyltransferase n=1 Tax=Tepidibacter hydrothermalis TaxID=3036126 RepID=A0ABY8ECV5_9FIRM|nr:tRNA (guanosine(46)-N7)-methyltransferase TrmB [Tepidibacter hydrothermalis]WFD10764.1 tRNA (guanosine(46)-N7)-methyltransferase TrmB [Tepidibacter hydrothermalis]